MKLHIKKTHLLLHLVFVVDGRALVVVAKVTQLHLGFDLNPLYFFEPRMRCPEEDSHIFTFIRALFGSSHGIYSSKIQVKLCQFRVEV